MLAQSHIRENITTENMFHLDEVICCNHGFILYLLLRTTDLNRHAEPLEYFGGFDDTH